MRTALFPILFALAACNGDDAEDTDAVDTDVTDDTDVDDTDAPADIAIAGTWVDEWGTTHTITNDEWSDSWDNVFHLSQYDNDEGWTVGQNDSANAYSAGLWSRFDWVFVGSDLYYCQSAFDAADEAAALATTPADATDPTTSGCGGFAWTAMDAQ